MKKKIFLVMLIFVSIEIYSKENEDDKIDNWSFNLLYNFYVFENINSPIEKFKGSLISSSISAGIGKHINVIPNILSPGIYIEGGFSVISLLDYLYHTNEYKKDNYYDNEISTEEEINHITKISSFAFVGIRLYNQLSFNLVDIQPFIGFSAFALIKDSLLTGSGCLNFGILFAYDIICIEYGYHIPYNNIKPIHRIGIGFHFNEK
jgi:hypothetical protein